MNAINKNMVMYWFKTIYPIIKKEYDFLNNLRRSTFRQALDRAHFKDIIEWMENGNIYELANNSGIIERYFNVKTVSFIFNTIFTHFLTLDKTTLLPFEYLFQSQSIPKAYDAIIYIDKIIIELLTKYKKELKEEDKHLLVDYNIV